MPAEPAKAVVFGRLISPKDRESLEKRYRDAMGRLAWCESPNLEVIDSDVSVVIVNLDDPLHNRPDLLVSIASAGQSTKLIGVAENPDTKDLISLSKLGVSEIISPEQCLQRLEAVLKESEQVVAAKSRGLARYQVSSLIGTSAPIKRIRETIRALADVDFPSALILGPTGTGKGLVAKILHHHGVRRDHNLVEVNCSAIPDELFESELFGHARGAFTDAKEEKKGLFEFANGGTLFLDEVGNLSASAQAKLLKVLEERVLRRVGDVAEIATDVRVVAATNLNLEEAVAEKRFREDLYFRLNLLTIEIPPLSQRPEDIPEIARHHLDLYTKLYNRSGLRISDKAIDILKQHPWPGNVRELSNVIERAVLMARGSDLDVSDLKSAASRSRLNAVDRGSIEIKIPAEGITLAHVESEVVKQVLNICNWNKSEAARYLQISRSRLRRIISRIVPEQNRRD
jgi:two-component system response regulator AtoC